MLDTLKGRVRERLWTWLGPGPQISPQTESLPLAPLGIDRHAGLPIHYDPPECPVCPKDSDSHICFDCGGTLQDSEWPFGVGVESATVTHLHEHVIPESGGRRIRTPARRKLCIPCFRIDWPKAYPDKPCDL